MRHLEDQVLVDRRQLEECKHVNCALLQEKQLRERELQVRHEIHVHLAFPCLY